MEIRKWQKIKVEMAKWLVDIVPPIALILLVILARFSGSMQYLEWQLLDNLLHLRPEEPLDKKIVIIGIDAEVLKVNK